MGKRLLACLLAVVLCCSCAVFASAADPAQDDAEALHTLGLFQGKGTHADGTPDYALEDAATRNEAAAMLLRLLGKQSKADAQYRAGNLVCPFGDVPSWAKSTVAFLYEHSYVNGSGNGTYGGSETITAQQFTVLLLRALGYSDSRGDFSYASALPFAVSKGLLTAGQSAQFSAAFTRGSMATLCRKALSLPMRDSNRTLQEKLTCDGVFRAASTALGNAPKLTLTPKYTGGGSDSKWYVQEATVGSPVVTDVNADGTMDLLYSARSLFCLNAKTGKAQWKTASGLDRSTAYTGTGDYGATAVRPKVADVDGDGAREIITVNTNYATATSCVAVYSADGYFKPGWPQYTNKPVRALTVADLDKDGVSELCLGLGTGTETIPSLYVYEADGSLRPGWPKTCGYGLYSDAITAADLDGDGMLEMILLFDDQFVCVFRADGTPSTATGGVYAGLAWNGLPVCEDYAHELSCVNWAKSHGGYAYATGDALLGSVREERNCIAGTVGGVTVSDLDGNGSLELACTAMVVDGSQIMRSDENTYEGSAQYFTTFLLNHDRTRYQNSAKGFDWTEMPTDPGPIATLNTNLLSTADNTPVTADVDRDGNQEILYTADDGMVHCWNLDGTEHGAWPYSLVSRSSPVLAFSSKPLCADVNSDGTPEVIFASYTQADQLSQRGRLYVLDGSGRVLASAVLPVTWGATQDVSGPNGCMAQPCAADVDGDGAMEIALTTLYCGVVVYDIG